MSEKNNPKQPPRGVPKEKCSKNMLQIYRRTPMPKCDFNKVSFITATHHLKKVVVETGLCGCTKFSNTWFVSVFLKGAAILIYCLIWGTTQSPLVL